MLYYKFDALVSPVGKKTSESRSNRVSDSSKRLKAKSTSKSDLIGSQPPVRDDEDGDVSPVFKKRKRGNIVLSDDDTTDAFSPTGNFFCPTKQFLTVLP